MCIGWLHENACEKPYMLSTVPEVSACIRSALLVRAHGTNGPNGTKLQVVPNWTRLKTNYAEWDEIESKWYRMGRD